MNFYNESDIPHDLRRFFVPAEIGLEDTPDAFVARLVEVFREVRRVLRDDGTLWLNIGDSYARTGGTDKTTPPTAKVGSTRKTVEARGDRTQRAPSGLKDKDMIGIPWMLAFALRADGWYLRQDIIWHKANPMPESVRDRCTKAHEYVFLMSKGPRYYFDAEAMKEKGSGRVPGNKKVQKIDSSRNDGGKTGIFSAQQKPQLTRNKRSVWTVATRPYKGAHFATFPPDLIEPCILAGSRPGDIVLDPFNGSGTTGQVSLQHGRKYLGLELNPDYVQLTKDRLI